MFDYIVAHGDEDGVCSAAILERYSPGAKIIISTPRDLPRTLAFIQKGSEVAIVDVALPRQIAEVIKAAESSRIYYIDHHPPPRGIDVRDIPFKEVKYDLGASASEIAQREYGDSRSEPLAIYGAIGDYMDETPYIRELLRKHDKRTVYYEAAMIGYSLAERRDPGFSARLSRALADQVRPGYVRGLEALAASGLRHEYEVYDYVRSHGKVHGKYALVEDPPVYGYAGRAAFYVMTYFGRRVGVCLVRREDSVDLIMRSDGSFDVGDFCRVMAEELSIEGGGHSRAASISVSEDLAQKVLMALSEKIPA